MGDEREFRIKITGDARGITAAGKESAEALKQTGKAAQEEADGLQESAKAADKAFVSKQQLKGAVKGLKDEFPALAHIARLALNPIALVVAGIGGAFALWTRRVQETQRVLAGLELPEIKSDSIGHINANAEAWGKYSEAIAKAAAASRDANAIHAAVIANIERELALNKALIKSVEDYAKAKLEANKDGMSDSKYAQSRQNLDTDASKATIAEEQQAGHDKFFARVFQMLDLRASAEAKRKEAGGIKIADADSDAKTLEKYKANAEAAEKDLKERMERLGKLMEYQSGGAGAMDSMWVKNQQFMTGMSVEEMIGLERTGAEQDRGIIGNYNKRRADGPARNKARQRREELLAGAAQDQAAANTIDQSLPEEERAVNESDAAQNRSEIYRQLTEAYKALAQMKTDFAKLQEESDKAVAAGHGLMQSAVNQLIEQQAAIAIMQKRIAKLEQTHPF